MTVQQLTGNIVKTCVHTKLPKSKDHYQPAYGCGLFMYITIGEEDGTTDLVEGCKTKNGLNEWICISPTEGLTFSVYVIKGDVEVIKEMVKKEFDHFDSNVTWA